MKRKDLKISVPEAQPDLDWTGWDLETFYLIEHLHELINSYGLERLQYELKECELQISRLKSNE